MRAVYSVTAGLAGVVVVALAAPFVPVSVGLAVGALVATVITLSADTDLYGLAGATLLLGVGTVVFVLVRFPAALSRTPLVALWLFGLLSLAVVVTRYLLGFVGRRVVAQFVPEDSADSVWNAISAFVGTLFIAWSVITAQEKATRTGGVALGGSTTMALDTLGYDVPVYVPLVHETLSTTVRGYELAVPLWVIENGVDATAIVFVGCVIVGFHTLGTVAAIWQAVKDTTGFARDTAQEVAGEPAGPGGPGSGDSGQDRTPTDEPPWAEDDAGDESDAGGPRGSGRQ